MAVKVGCVPSTSSHSVVKLNSDNGDRAVMMLRSTSTRPAAACCPAVDAPPPRGVAVMVSEWAANRVGRTQSVESSLRIDKVVARLLGESLKPNSWPSQLAMRILSIGRCAVASAVKARMSSDNSVAYSIRRRSGRRCTHKEGKQLPGRHGFRERLFHAGQRCCSPPRHQREPSGR